MGKNTEKVLSTFLADTYLLLVKTQNFHWNVADSRFAMLHELFEEQYKDLFAAADEIAERLRALKKTAPGSMKEFLSLATLKEEKGKIGGDKMLQALLKDHEQVASFLRKSIPIIQEEGDEGTADLFIQRLRAHDKTAWMLRSHLAK